MSTQDNNIRVQSQKDPAQLEREIDQQRDHIAELVNALGSKLSPGEMIGRVLSYSKDGSREFAGNLGHTVRSNPVPTLLTAAGLLWLYAGGRHDSSGLAAGTSATDSVGAQKPHLGERMQHVRQGTSERIQDVRRTAHDAADSARYRVRRVNEGLHHMLEDNPMALGAMSIAAGALLGAMLPVTRKEHELMGEASDRLTREARQAARSGLDAAAGRESGFRDEGDVSQTRSGRPGIDTGKVSQPPPIA